MQHNKSKIGDAFIILIFIILILVCILPMMNVFSRALSSAPYLIRGEVGIFPRGITMQNFELVWSDAKYPRSLAWTAILTLIAATLSLTLTIMCAFPFVYKQLKARKTINFLLIFTMYFGAGTIPTFLLYRTLGLIDNPLVMIIPNALSIFNFILMRSFFYGIPDSIRESAEIDGAGPFKVLTLIYLPLSKASLATIFLFYAVGRWNGYGDALVFMPRATEWYPIQLLLYNIQQGFQNVDVVTQEGFLPVGIGEGIKTATIVIATVPILMIYPFLQKYFVAGATMGAIKE